MTENRLDEIAAHRDRLSHDLDNYKVIAQDWELESEQWQRRCQELCKALQDAKMFVRLVHNEREPGDPIRNDAREFLARIIELLKAHNDYNRS